MVTEYDYHDGTWDAAERTFAGFGGGTERAIVDASTPTLLTENTYDVGLVHRTLCGQPLTIEARDEQGYIFTRTTNTYRTLTLGTSGVEYSYRDSETVVHVEGKDESAARTVLTEWEHDEYGNETLVAKWGEVVGTDRLAGNDETIVRKTYANDPSDWLLGYVATERTEDASGTRVAEKRWYYDGEAFKGLALGQVTRGDLRRVESWIEGDRFADEQKNDHDEHGNVVSSIDGRGGRTELEYDDASRTFILAEQRIVNGECSLSWGADYDPRFGSLTRLVGPNGDVTRLGLDVFGRIVAIAKPGDTLAAPSVTYAYTMSAPLSTVRTEAREERGKAGMLVSFGYVDGLGRKRGDVVESATEGRWILTGLGTLDARGNPAFSAFPTEERSSELPVLGERGGTRSLYDATGRVLETRHLDATGTRTAYGPLSKTVWDENDNDPSSVHHDTPTTHVTDGLGRLVQVIERARSEAGTGASREIVSGQYGYDALGNAVSIIDAVGGERRYAFDGRSRLRSIDDPNAGRWERRYTDGDDLERQVDPEGHEVRYEYDALGRQLEESHQLSGEEEELITSYHYDAPSSEHSDYANLLGRLAWVEDAAGAVYFDYTDRGLVDTRTRRWSDGKEHTTFTDYDDLDRPVRRGYPDNSVLGLSYDARGLLRAQAPSCPRSAGPRTAGSRR